MYGVVLFIHLAAVAGAFFTSGIATAHILRARTLENVIEASQAIATAARAGKLMPIFLLLLVVTGAIMVRAQWSWSEPWIDVALLGAVLLVVIGGGISGRREAAIHVSVRANDSSRAIEMIRDPLLALAEGMNTGIAVGIVFTMVCKPALAGAVAAVLTGAVVGLLGAYVVVGLGGPRRSVDAAKARIKG